MNDATARRPMWPAPMLEYEAIWRLGPDSLELQGGRGAAPDVVMRLPYRDIVRVRLSYAPCRVDSARYRCDFRMCSGQQLAILWTHYAGRNPEGCAAGLTGRDLT